VELEKNGEDQLDRWCKKSGSIGVQEEMNIPHTIKEGRLIGLVTSCVETAF
jgi:hypothetical protein